MVGIVDYGAGNLRSVQKALEAIGERALIAGDAAALDGCERLILPGVGSFGAAWRNCARGGWTSMSSAASRRDQAARICLGMQFLLEMSYEEGEWEGLGIVPGRVVRFAEGKIPQIGWNRVFRLRTPLFDGIAEDTRFYFVHSYRADCADAYAAAMTDYFVDYPSAVWSGSAYGVQFHPEKSGAAGLRLLQNFCRL